MQENVTADPRPSPCNCTRADFAKMLEIAEEMQAIVARMEATLGRLSA